MNGSNGGYGEKEFIEERVAFTLSKKHARLFIPRISVSKTVDRQFDKAFRKMVPEDIPRILDFDNVPDPPPDGPLMHGEGELDSIQFPKRHCLLRGGFLFVFDLANVSGQLHFVTYHGPPRGVIPLQDVKIEFPPGGRRVFREHAQTDARTGYEFAVLEPSRPPAFLCAESLGRRDVWAAAITARAGIDAHTSLRAVVEGSFATKPAEILKEKEQKQDKKQQRKGKRASMQHKDTAADKEENAIQEALQEFGKNNFSEKTWIDNYFETHNDVDAQARCRRMERWQEAIKKGLKNAVLEQYEYFVEASAEMTKMGREVVELKALVETQVETIKDMKEIDFAVATRDAKVASDAILMDSIDGDDLFHDGTGNGKRRKGGLRRNKSAGSLADDQSAASSESSFGGGAAGTRRKAQNGVDTSTTGAPKYRDPQSKDGTIEIPENFGDVAEEIAAYVKESRYTDATELWSKTKSELTEIMNQHESPTDNFFTKKEFSKMTALAETLDELAQTISKRLVENLRRKNEALKQASKPERSDPMAHLVPSVSPTCLNDDAIPLRLLVKLGKTQEAATAYSARRSLLLLESLHERPLSRTGNVDLVIYAAQLSQSFFSCLANAIEGFLDLFAHAAAEKSNSREDSSLDASSIHTHMRDLPAGALASIVLWCDSELSKFSASFGGTRILGNLALTPPPQDARKGPRVLGEDANGNKDRQAAIEVAAQCVGQAFQYASENLDTVGLPLTPRLAVSLRKRLKGCEVEVSKLLDDHWKPIVYEWETSTDHDDVPLDELRSIH